MNRKDIRVTLPRIDCRFCVLHNFHNMQNEKLDEQYAECTNQEKTFGMVSIDITLEGNPLQWETSCHNCKKYESVNQLSLFD